MQYLAALWDDKAKRGPFPQLYTNDPKEAEEFIRNCDREGRTVVRCVGVLQPDAKERRIETVKSLSFLHGDIDLRELAGVSKEEVIQKLKALPLRLRLHDSGRGVHWYTDLKEPVDAGTPEYDRACALRTQLTHILASDTAVDHSAALMRVPGTHNYKCNPPALCQVIEEGRTNIGANPVWMTFTPLLGMSEVVRRFLQGAATPGTSRQ